MYHLATIIGLLLTIAAHAQSTAVAVSDDASLRTAIAAARPGTRIRLAAGRYSPGLFITLAGTKDAPIIIEGADDKDPPRFEGGKEALHLSDCTYVTIRNLAFKGQSANGINVDDAGSAETPSHHITLERLDIREVGSRGNQDAIKLSGLDHFVVRDCRIEGWGGQAIDMVGCHHGLIEGCTIKGRAGFSQHTGPQTKGGTSDVIIRRCDFIESSGRGVNIGGSTGLEYFRPRGARYEARDITVEGCRFVGCEAPVAFVGVDGAIVRYNTFYHPAKWALRILQETTAEGFVPCRNGRYERNLIVFRGDVLRPAVNIGAHTAPETFVFSDNLWYREDRPAASRPDLPTREQNSIYGLDPKLKDPAKLEFTPGEPRAQAYGADALKSK